MTFLSSSSIFILLFAELYGVDLYSRELRPMRRAHRIWTVVTYSPERRRWGASSTAAVRPERQRSPHARPALRPRDPCVDDPCEPLKGAGPTALESVSGLGGWEPTLQDRHPGPTVLLLERDL